MNAKYSSERLAEAMNQARRHWQAQRRVPVEAEGAAQSRRPAVTVAISREAGADGSAIARLVGEQLGWPVYDRELVQIIAQEMGLRASLLSSVDEKHGSWLRECLPALSLGPAVSESAYVRHLIETLLSLAVHGECVIVGRGAAQLLPPDRTLRARLVGPPAERVEAIRQRFGIATEEATRWVANADGKRAQFVRDHFHKDPADACGYDLILNASRLSRAACAGLIIEALGHFQAQPVAEVPEEAACPHACGPASIPFA